MYALSLYIDKLLYSKIGDNLNNMRDNWIEVNLKKDPNQLLKFISSFPIPRKSYI